ncbi:MAG: M28 family peptidase [Aquabacterium sp.]
MSAIAAGCAWPPLAQAQAQTAALQPVGPLTADLDIARRLRDAALQGAAADSLAYRLVASLTQEVGARPAGSPADERAVQWALRQAQAVGLSQARAERFDLRVWQRGPAAAFVLPGADAAPGTPSQRLNLLAVGNSVPTAPGGIEAELAWFADIAALRALPAEGQPLAGRIVFIDQRTERTRDGTGYGRAVPARTQGAIEAARRGALAMVVRSIGTDDSSAAHTGAMSYDLRVPAIPAATLAVADAQALAARHAAGERLRMRLDIAARRDVAAASANVLADLPGREPEAGIVLLGAHLDSWDVGEGALDDAAGVGIALASVSLLARIAPQPRRSVRVVLFGNEENGFDGARDYARRHADEPHQLVAESDFGDGAPWRLDSRVHEQALPVIDALAGLLAPLGVARGSLTGSAGPDAAFLMRSRGWPALNLMQDGSRYFDLHHTERDVLAAVDPQALRTSVACWAPALWLAAQAPLSFGPIRL